MEMIHGDFKVGETVRRQNAYSCVACGRAGRATRVELAEKAVFPFCTACRELGAEEMDMLWRATVTGRSRA